MTVTALGSRISVNSLQRQRANPPPPGQECLLSEGGCQLSRAQQNDSWMMSSRLLLYTLWHLSHVWQLDSVTLLTADVTDTLASRSEQHAHTHAHTHTHTHLLW